MRIPPSVLPVGILTAVAIGVVGDLRAADAVAAAVAVTALAGLATSRRGAASLLFLGLLCAAAAHGAAARDRALRPALLVWFDKHAGNAERLSEPVVIDGVVAQDAALAEDGVRLVVDVWQVRDATGWRRAPGRVLLHVAGAQGAGHVRDWTAGRPVRASASLRRPQVFLNFGGVSPFWQQLRRPFVLSGSVKSAALVEVQRGAWWAEMASRARWRARDAAARFVAPRDPQAAAILIAILVGDRSGLDEGLIRRLQVAGTYHVIAISGGNVALLTGLCFGLLGIVLRSPRVVAGVTLGLTLAYGGVVGGDPSVARAVAAATIYLGAGAAGLVPSPLATLRTVGVVLTLADPLIVADVGAWLSFGATLGILVLASRILRTVPWRRCPPGLALLARPVVALVGATLAAELVLLPIAAAVFGRVTAAGLVLNVVAIPVMAVVQIGGLIVVAAGPVWPALGHVSAVVATWAAHALVFSSTLVQAWPWLSWRVPPVSVFWIAAYYAAGVVVWWTQATVRHAARLIAVLALAIIALAPATERTRPAAGRMRVTMVDVGQGDATLLQLPNGDSLLIDAGGSPGTFDVGSRVVTPAVWALGVRRLSWLALTHPDIDHIGGAVGATDDLSPREIWEGIPVLRDPDWQRIRAFADARGVAWRRVRSRDSIDIGGRITIDALHPPEPDWERQKSRNEDSLVLRIRYGDVDILLTGDAGAEFDDRLPADLNARPIRILKAGHHGSRTSTSDRLVAALRPQIALISVGRGNMFGQPAPDVIKRLEAAGAAVFRTDRDGAVSVETDGVTVRVRTALGRSWMVAAAGPS